MNRKSLIAATTIAVLLGLSGSASAQQANISGPFNNIGTGFYENIGVNWGLRGPGWFFNFGGPPPGPGFGGFDPNAGAQFGAGFKAGNTSGFFNLTAGQGANTTFVSQTPNVTIPNGGNGYFIDGQFRPFVTSIMPIVGDPVDPSPLRERMRRIQEGEVAITPSSETTASSSSTGGGGGGASNRPSTAERGDLSVAAIKAQAAAADQADDAEIAVLLEKGKGAEAAGKPNVARIYYQMAARKAQGEQQQAILKHLQSLPK